MMKLELFMYNADSLQVRWLTMLKQFIKFMSGSDLRSFRTDISRQNRMAIRYFALAGIPVSIGGIAAQTIIKGVPSLTQNSVWMLIYFLALVLINRFAIPDECRWSTPLVYLLSAPVMVVSILLGTVWDPSHQALTYLMFMVVMPVFILDLPWRVLAVMAGWNAVFLLLCYTIKEPQTRRGDLVHVVEFFISSISVTMVVLKLRFDVIRGQERVRFHMEHDTLTGTRNRQSFEANLPAYLNRRLIVLMGDLDQLAMINDFYGREVGDDVLASFASVLQELFGEEHVYRYGGDELLCVIPDGEEPDCLDKIERCRQKLATQYEGGQHTSTCSFGYVAGRPTDADTFRNMVQLADIQVHKAGRQNQEGTLGCAYDEGALRAGIVEANISTHLKAYETNQLTGLPGMEYFIARCDEMLGTLVELDKRPVIGFLNLLRFQAFNDTFGYEQGDALARKLVELLHEVFPSRMIAYLSGGRFAVMCYLSEAEPGIERINRALAAYRPGYGVEVKAGFAEFHRGDYVISLLDKAKLSHDSVYSVKGAYFRLYDETIDDERHYRQYLVSHLDEAIEKGWIKVYYQPIIRTLSGEICNLEALSRWDDPQYGFLMPGRFIPILEQEWVVYKLNLHVVRQAIRDFKLLEEQGLPLVPISVNLSRRDFSECDMVREITAAMDEAGYPHELLKIEITESAFMENPELLRREVDRFQENGFQVWMDDFGSEYSTLNLLNELNFNLIKIDMRFMKNFSATGRNGIIIDDIIGMSKRLGITTLVEGVETEEQLAALNRLGSEKLQGFYFSRPVPLRELLDAIASGKLKPTEHGDRAAYYTLLGNVNLHAPLSENSGLGLTMSQSIPAGIIELYGDRCYMVRENEAMYDRRASLSSEPENDEQPLSALPECFVTALRQAAETDGWVYAHGANAQGRGLSIHARRVSEGTDGRAAMLVVVLPG